MPGVRPIGSCVWLVLEREPGHGVKVGTLYIAEWYVDGVPTFGRVVAVGPKCRQTKVGDLVLIGELTGEDVLYQGVWYRVVRKEDHIMARIR